MGLPSKGRRDVELELPRVLTAEQVLGQVRDENAEDPLQRLAQRWAVDRLCVILYVPSHKPIPQNRTYVEA